MNIYNKTRHEMCNYFLSLRLKTNLFITSFVVFACNKTETIRALSRHNSIDNENKRYQCPDGMHTKSEAVPVVLCGVPEHSIWHHGKNVSII